MYARGTAEISAQLAIMAVSVLAIERVVAALKADIASTLGTDHEWLVDQTVQRGLSFIDEDAWFTRWLVEGVQQYFHDTFVDTTWPACPRHPNHPLWFEDGWWRCGSERIAKLGELASIRTSA